MLKNKWISKIKILKNKKIKFNKRKRNKSQNIYKKQNKLGEILKGN